MEQPLTYDLMRQRVMDLASTGRYAGWPEIVRAAGYHPVLIRRIEDADFIALVNVRCRLAGAATPIGPVETGAPPT
jgi:hypothetical protein